MKVENLQVVLVGHSIGGACISYALEHYPQKISKAIFLCATMVTDGQRPFDVFADQVSSTFIYLLAVQPQLIGVISSSIITNLLSHGSFSFNNSGSMVMT